MKKHDYNCYRKRITKWKAQRNGKNENHKNNTHSTLTSFAYIHLNCYGERKKEWNSRVKMEYTLHFAHQENIKFKKWEIE